jgi:hypothetical protein
MATNSKVFVSPGVYTSEVDLSFVAQSVGVTTLGIAGETLKGPAFEPIFVRNFDEYSTYFGGTTPEKFVNTQIPKYEASYIAKAYLQQSNQLFVTRILGLSGYDAGPSWSIVTKANVDPTTVQFNCLSGAVDPSTCEFVCYTAKTLSFVVNFTGCTNGLSTISFETAFPNEIESILTEDYEGFDGSISTIDNDIKNLINSVITNVDPLTAQTNNISYFGAIDGDDYDTLATIFSAETNVYDIPSVSGFNNEGTSVNDYTSSFNDAWYYSLFDNVGGGAYSGFSFFTYVDDLVEIIPITTTSTTMTPSPTPSASPANPCVSPTPLTSPTPTPTPVNIDCWSGSVVGKIYYYEGTAYTDYDDLVVGTLRSRGIATYSDANNPVYEVSNINNVTLNMTGQYVGVLKNPYLPFALNVTNDTGTNFTFETSFSQSDSQYIAKVFGGTNFGKPRLSTPLFLEERFQSLLNYGWRKGYIRGLSTDLVALDSAQSADPQSIGWYLDKYQSPSSPWVVSELRGNKTFNLFKFYTISDGNSANSEVKISFINMSFANRTFDVLVRDYYDVDSNPVVIEKFTNCSMDPSQNNFIAKKIGTLDGEYELNSKYIMVEMNEDAPVDALPCGFDGYNFREYAGVKSPFPIYKTKYDYPGEVIYNPPFGLSTGADDAIKSSGDNVRRTYLGFSNNIGFDTSFFEYKGKRNPLTTCDLEGGEWSYKTRGFHMDQFASGITISSGFSTSGTPKYYAGAAPFSSEPTSPTDPYYRLFSRKFTMLVYGGFDGWDIYREYRTNGDRFVLGRQGFLNGACVSDRYPTATGWGAFKQISIGDGTTDYANTDYYAYLLGIKTFANPEAVNINVFASPGIDYVNNSDLVEATIDMIENERADSLYITTTPDYNMFVPTTTEGDNLIYPQEAVDNLETTGIDSNYTATYYPWVLTRDSVNNTQIYIPATAEVTRNLALTDNIAFPWFASAGYTRGLVNSIKARKKLTQEDRDVLYVGRINPIATFADVGTVIWGNKTLQVRESALDRINVRRLLLQARKLISAVSVRLLFDQNDEQVRQDFLNAVNPILDAIRRDRGLYDFRVTVSSDTEDLDRNQMTGKIYIKPTRSLEFIDITFYITPTGASFDDV